MKYLHLRLEELLTERGLSKKKVCSALDVERTNFNRYYRDEFQRLDANFPTKLWVNLDYLFRSSYMSV